jgi:hypothetical protein
MEGIPSIPQNREHQDMPAQIKDGPQAAATDSTIQRTQDLIIQLVRHGQDTSLRSLQVWADLARQLSSTALRSPARAMMISVAYDLFEKVLRAQRQVVDELVATQRQLAQQFLTTITAIIGGYPARW